jgi:hypothetical protein
MKQQERYSLFRQQHHITTSITHSRNKSIHRRICCGCLGRWNIMIYSFIAIMMIIQVLQVLQVLYYVNDDENIIRTISTIPYNRSTGMSVTASTTATNNSNNNTISVTVSTSIHNISNSNNTKSTPSTIPLPSNSTLLLTSSASFSMNHDTDDDWHIHIAHEPRYDLLGSFVIPTLLLFAVTNYHGANWELVILPFLGTQQHAMLQDLVKLGNKIDTAWGSGFQDANHRVDYDPVQLNAESYQNMGFFPNISSNSILNEYPWIRTKKLPSLGKELNDVCENNEKKRNVIGDDNTNATTTMLNDDTRNNDKSRKQCYILLSDEPQHIRTHIDHNGGMGKFFNPTFCQQIRDQFLHHNAYRLQKYYLNYNITIRTCYNNSNNYDINHNNSNCHTNTDADTGTTNVQHDFHVAMHIRRGDILHPDRWTNQTVFANVGRTICEQNAQLHPTMKTYIHVFSSGPNRDGDWSIMESIGQMNTINNISIIDNDDDSNMTTPSSSSSSLPPPCAGVYFHLNEIEYDSWTFMIAADALVISKSTFSYVPALIRYRNVYMPLRYWYPNLPSFHVFNETNGEILW